MATDAGGSISLGVWSATDHGRRLLSIQKAPETGARLISVDLMRPLLARQTGEACPMSYPGNSGRIADFLPERLPRRAERRLGLIEAIGHPAVRASGYLMVVDYTFVGCVSRRLAC
jgi:hypothetical protein